VILALSKTLDILLRKGLSETASQSIAVSSLLFPIIYPLVGQTPFCISPSHAPTISPSYHPTRLLAAMPATTRSLETMVLQAHRAKGVRYPTLAQKDCFKTWYAYALRQGEVQKTKPKVMQEYGKYLREVGQAAPGGRTYL
jgi:hypothetical protein